MLLVKPKEVEAAVPRIRAAYVIDYIDENGQTFFIDLYYSNKFLSQKIVNPNGSVDYIYSIDGGNFEYYGNTVH
ncbi:hypothetical protein [Enterococcus timonensis]|uniref:hypothetical protein n=1 Tax=Enterococcus timonensis TaxID=1852364 RepID=UPI0008DA4956|nr:hypothetical protein [Enterococcus timonensis]